MTSTGEHSLSALWHRAAHAVVTELSTRPHLYYAARTITGKRDYRCTGPGTQIVIEGYPRSANSCTVHEFLDRQSRPVEIAHHTHHVAQLLWAVERRIAAVVLIRTPVDAIQSLVALAAEGFAREGRRGRGSYLTFEDCAWAWLRFYAPLVPHRAALVIGRFEEVTRDVPGLIRRINERFGTSFETVRQRQTVLGYHASPNPLRSVIKAQVGACFAARLRTSASLRRLIEDCRRTYDAFDDASGASGLDAWRIRAGRRPESARALLMRAL